MHLNKCSDSKSITRVFHFHISIIFLISKTWVIVSTFADMAKHICASMILCSQQYDPDLCIRRCRRRPPLPVQACRPTHRLLAARRVTSELVSRRPCSRCLCRTRRTDWRPPSAPSPSPGSRRAVETSGRRTPGTPPCRYLKSRRQYRLTCGITWRQGDNVGLQMPLPEERRHCKLTDAVDKATVQAYICRYLKTTRQCRLTYAVTWRQRDNVGLQMRLPEDNAAM